MLGLGLKIMGSLGRVLSREVTIRFSLFKVPLKGFFSEQNHINGKNPCFGVRPWPFMKPPLPSGVTLGESLKLGIFKGRSDLAGRGMV